MRRVIVGLHVALLVAACSSSRRTASGPDTPDGPFCGDGVRDANEACDDGNTNDGDGCSATCTLEPTSEMCEADTCRYFVHEWTIAHPDDAYANPFEEVTVTMTLTAPSGATLSVFGFYYDADTWKIRFAPREVGEYTFAYRLDDATGTRVVKEGTLSVGASDRRGFLVPDPHNRFRFVHEGDGGVFGGVGLSTCVRDSVATQFPTPQEPKGWCIDKVDANDESACGKTWSEWSSVYVEQTEIDLFRWSVNNCSYPLWEQLVTDGGTPDNVYDVEHGKWGDRMLRDLVGRGVRVYLDPVGFGWQAVEPGRRRCGPNWDEDCADFVCGRDHDLPCTDQNAARIDLSEVAALERYFTYVVARYGAWIDFVELVNEYFLDDGTIQRLAEHVRSVDPYGHPVTVSWARPDHPSIDMSSPHVYQRSDPFDSDRQLLDAVVAGRSGAESFPKAVHGKPIVIGELGEPFGPDDSPRYRERTRLGTRVKMWTAFFNEVHGIPWESSLSGAQFLGGVVFVGPELRADFRALSRFVRAVDPDVVIQPVIETNAGSDPVRVYTLRGASNVYGYVFHASPTLDASSATGLTIDIDVPRAGRIEWYATDDGRTIESIEVTAGVHTLVAPSFTHDVAFRSL